MGQLRMQISGESGSVFSAIKHHQADKQPQTAVVHKDLINALHKLLPSRLQAEDLKGLVDALRGHMRILSWAEPWLFKDVIAPLLEDNRAQTDHACDIWIRELTEILDPDVIEPYLSFDRQRQGELTNIAAYLFAGSSPEQQLKTLKRLDSILKKQGRSIQQPLASSSNWTQWDRSLTVSMWLLAFCRWSQYYFGQSVMVPPELGQFTDRTHALSTMRSRADWKREGSGALAAFVEQAENLLANLYHTDGSVQ